MNLSRRFAHGTFALLPWGEGNGMRGDARAVVGVRLSHLAGKE